MRWAVAEAMGTLVSLLREITAGSKVDVAAICGSYGKVCVAVDEMVGAGGLLESTDVDHIIRQTKLKAPVALKK